MKKATSRLLALTLAAMLTLAGCTNKEGTKDPAPNPEPGGNQGVVTPTPEPQTTAKPITDYTTYQTAANELQTFNILTSQLANEMDVLSNCVEGLVSVDNYGRLVPAIAESWETKDNGLTWTFKLRQGIKWVDINGKEMADCNAQDFITGLEWVLNFHKNAAANTSMPIELIKGADEYYQYTRGLEEADALALDKTKFLEMVGIAAPDDYTLVYTCVSPKPYFDTVASYNCLFPASQALIDQLGVAGFLACDNTNMWYNGPYILTDYVQSNEKVLSQNPTYWDKEVKRFNTVTVKMVDSADVAFQMYQSGELDYVALTESNLKTIYDNPDHEFHDNLVERRPTKYSFQMHLNYNKLFADGTPDVNHNTALANEAFRLSMYYGLDLTNYLKRTNTVNPLKCENNFYTMRGLVYTSDGTDYVDLVKERLGIGDFNGETLVRYNKEKGEQYKKQAMEELTAQGVTFPIQLDYYISGSSQTALDTATVLKQAFSQSLGDDYIVLNIKTYITSSTKEVRDPKLQSFMINGWGADYGDPQNYLGQETYGYDNAWYSTAYSNINDVAPGPLVDTYKEYTAMVEKANAINDDMDARYNAFADAEAFLLQHALVIPTSYDIAWCLTHANDYSKPNAMFGGVNGKYLNWETSEEAYTTEQYKAFEEAYNKGMTK